MSASGLLLDRALWISGDLVQIMLLATLLRRAFYKEFPLFTSFIVFSLLSDLILLFSQRTPFAYFIAYFALKIPESLLELGLLLEIASNVVRHVRRSLPKGMLWLLAGLVVAGALGGVALALYAKPPTLNLISGAYFRVTFGIAVLRLLIFAAIAGFAQLLGIGWKNYVLQLSTGLAFYGTVSVAVELYIFQFGMNSVAVDLTRVRVAAYMFTLGYWIWSFSRQEVPRRNFSPQMEKVLVSLSGSARSTREALRSPGVRQ